MPKLTRGKYIIYIDASFGKGEPTWFKIGKSLSSLAVELNPDVSTEKNIFDEVFVTDNGYTPQTSVDPYYANPDDAIYEHIRNIAMNRLVGDECRTKIMEVIIEHDGQAAHSAWIEDVVVKPTSTGGDTAGFSIPFEVYFDGNRVEGNAAYDNSYKDSEPIFTAVAITNE